MFESEFLFVSGLELCSNRKPRFAGEKSHGDSMGQTKNEPELLSPRTAFHHRKVFENKVLLVVLTMDK